MKKQFFRVKQLADQTFLRADKSEVFNYEELQIADQKVEYLRAAISAIIKKIPSSGQGNDVDKRRKKTVEYHLGQVFLEQGARKGEQGAPEDECSLFQHILRECGAIEDNLSKEYGDHEKKVEEMVCEPLQALLDDEFPSILKNKRNLSKYILDKDSASNRYHSTKKEALKDDMEEADSKVEQSRDTLAYEMFGLLARENELSSHILQLLKLQRGYHESALEILEGVIPELEKKIGDSSIKRVFGISLREHLRVTKKRIAFPLEICITTLSKYGMSEEGVFRIVGSISKVKRLKSAIDSGCLCRLIPEYRDVHVLASTLKLYLRELPEPLLTYHLHDEWMQAMQYSENQRLESVRALIARLPQENRENLAYLMQFLAKLSHHPENKMNSSNIAIVIAPNLLWNKSEANMGNCATTNMLVELFVKEVDALFPDDVSRHVDLPQSLLLDEEEEVNSKGAAQGRDVDHCADFNISSESIHVMDSPRPSSRKKKPAAPVPPNSIVSKTDQDLSDKTVSFPSYPSGSSTLNRPQKSKESPKVKTSVGINTEDDLLSPARRRSFAQDDAHKSPEVPKVANLVNLDTKTVEHKYVTQPAANIQVSKAKPVQPVVAQSANCDKNFKTTVVHQIFQQSPEEGRAGKPVAAPRSALQDPERSAPVSRTSSMRGDVMSKSASEAFGDVQLRKPEAAERAHKPEVPARPASLQKRASIDAHLDPTLQRTQCSVYSVANKQQPSIVNLQNRTERFQPGHDNLIAEKEKFLGHQPAVARAVENKFADVNSNKPGLPPKALMRSNEKLDAAKSNERLNVTKSTEKLSENGERLNGNQRPSHVRTRSDGNLIDLGELPPSLLHTPPSPRSLNKPTQPPPPPPVNINKVKEPDSTDL